MSPTLKFEALPDSPFPFDTTEIELYREYEAYVIGFRSQPSSSPTDLEDDKLCIVPLQSLEANDMTDPVAAIWLAPGYKVMIIPAEGSKIYYQRAKDNINVKWNEVKEPWAFGHADPLMTALDDGAVHIKFDTRPTRERRRAGFVRKIHNFFHPDHAADVHKSLAKHIHTEIDGGEAHASVRRHAVVARVTVIWDYVRGKRVTQHVPLRRPVPDYADAGAEVGDHDVEMTSAGSEGPSVRETPRYVSVGTQVPDSGDPEDGADAVSACELANIEVVSGERQMASVGVQTPGDELMQA